MGEQMDVVKSDEAHEDDAGSVQTEEERLYAHAVDIASKSPNDAIPLLRQLIFSGRFQSVAQQSAAAESEHSMELEEDTEGQQTSHVREQSILKLSSIYAKLKMGSALVMLLSEIRPMFQHMAKLKSARIVRTVIDSLGEIPDTVAQQIELCKEYADWARKEKRTFLRQRIQTRLAALYVQASMYSEALALCSELQMEVKKLDDKIALVEIYLIESHAHQALLNRNKAKSSLTAARSNATSTYVGQLLQAEIDLQGGILNADDKDYRTAFSYFLEAFEGFHALGDKRALTSLKYMILAKIMNNQGDDVPVLLNSKNALKYHGIETEALRAAAKANKDRSLRDFDLALQTYSAQLVADPFISHHLQSLHGALLEKNLAKIIEPYSRVEISHVAKLIDLPVDRVESTISSMILDKKFHGILDQGAGVLIVFEDAEEDNTYDVSLELISNLGSVVESLLRRSASLS